MKVHHDIIILRYHKSDNFLNITLHISFNCEYFFSFWIDFKRQVCITGFGVNKLFLYVNLKWKNAS